MPKKPCLCGCVRSDEAVALRRAREAEAARAEAVNHAAFDLFYEDRKAGRPTMAVADYIAIAEDASRAGA